MPIHGTVKVPATSMEETRIQFTELTADAQLLHTCIAFGPQAAATIARDAAALSKISTNTKTPEGRDLVRFATLQSGGLAIRGLFFLEM